MKTEATNRKIRDLVNESIIKKSSIFSKKQSGYWDQFCAALDTIGDTSLAITSFLSITDQDFLINPYISTYGVLQALVLQQDAVNHLKVSLFGADKKIIWRTKYPELERIRELRHETIGHPTDTKKNGRQSKYNKNEITFCAISRYTLSKDGFDYFLYRHSGSEQKHIEFKKVIISQDDNLQIELSKIFKELQREEKLHKLKFKNDKLSDLLILGDQSFYRINLIYGVQWGDHLAWLSFNHYYKLYKKIRSGLEARYGELDSMLRIPGTKEVIKKLDYLFSKLETFKVARKYDAYEFEVHVDALDVSLNELKEHLKEIDEEFQI